MSQKGGSSYSYDPNGNMISRPWGSGTQTLTYDYENRLVSVSGSGTASFAYDADGNRVWQDVDGTETHYVWDWGESGANYYYGGCKVAMRNETINYLCGSPIHLHPLRIHQPRLIPSLFQMYDPVRRKSIGGLSMPSNSPYIHQFAPVINMNTW